MKNKQFLGNHVSYSKEYEKKLKSKNFRGILLYRDPIDVIISYIFWVIKDFNLVPPKQKTQLHLLDIDTILTQCIKNIDNYYRNYIPWIKSPIFYSVKFEDLVGEKGGGSLNQQIISLENICKHIGINHTKNELSVIAKNLFGNTGTFRKGLIGSWKKYFSNEHKKLFKKTANQLLIELGYEKDLNW